MDVQLLIHLGLYHGKFLFIDFADVDPLLVPQVSPRERVQQILLFTLSQLDFELSQDFQEFIKENLILVIRVGRILNIADQFPPLILQLLKYLAEDLQTLVLVHLLMQ